MPSDRGVRADEQRQRPRVVSRDGRLMFDTTTQRAASPGKHVHPSWRFRPCHAPPLPAEDCLPPSTSTSTYLTGAHLPSAIPVKPAVNQCRQSLAHQSPHALTHRRISYISGRNGCIENSSAHAHSCCAGLAHQPRNTPNHTPAPRSEIPAQQPTNHYSSI